MTTSLAEGHSVDAGAPEPRPGDVGEILSAYLQEIGRVPLLAPGDEVELVAAIEAGRAARDRLRRGESLSPREAERLVGEVRRGHEARRQLMEANLRLVVSIARRYPQCGLPLGDLIQEGNLGLLRAVEKFDCRRGCKFSTYATWWIRQSVGQAVAEKSRTIRIPERSRRSVNRVKRAIGQLRQELGRAPTAGEVSAALGLPEVRVRELLATLPEPLSLDLPIGSEQDTPQVDLIEDRNAVDPADAAGRALLREQVWRVLASLSARQRRVLELRYGLDGDRERTLAEVGGMLGVTRERVRQIEAVALGRLRHPTRARKLRAYAG